MPRYGWIWLLASGLALTSCNGGRQDNGMRQFVSVGSLEISAIPLPPDYNTARVSVSQQGKHCVDGELSEGNAILILSNDSALNSCGEFNVALRLAPPVDDYCASGYVYLVSGPIPREDDSGELGRSFVTEGDTRIVAAWDEQGNATTLQRPYEEQMLLRQYIVPTGNAWEQGQPLSAAGMWRLELDLSHPGSISQGCTLDTFVDLAITAADSSQSERTVRYQFSVTPLADSDAVIFSASAEGASAPLPLLDLVPSNGRTDVYGEPARLWRLSFTGLDALRDSKVEATVRTLSPRSGMLDVAAFQPAVPSIVIRGPGGEHCCAETGIDITENSTPARLSDHIAGFLDALTLALRDQFDTAGNSVSLRLAASFTLRQASEPSPAIELPIALVPSYLLALSPTQKQQADCALAPEEHLSCELGRQIEHWISLNLPEFAPDLEPGIIIDLVFFGTAHISSAPVLSVRGWIPLNRVVPGDST